MCCCCCFAAVTPDLPHMLACSWHVLKVPLSFATSDKVLLGMIKAKCTKRKKYVLVVSIDNLDRCPHRQIVKVLEAVHLLLEQEEVIVFNHMIIRTYTLRAFRLIVFRIFQTSQNIFRNYSAPCGPPVPHLACTDLLTPRSATP